jgi:hypothetical protein
MAESGDERNVSIESHATSNPRQDQFGDRRVEVPQEDNEASKEEEDGKVEHGGQSLEHPWKEKVINPISIESAVTSPPGFAGSGTWLCDLQVFPCPLL